jgi:hypothetical protein
MTTTKIVRLSPINVLALRETLTPTELATVHLGATVAEFQMDATDARDLVVAAQGRCTDRYSHPYMSLHAVVRKLAAAGAVNR